MKSRISRGWPYEDNRSVPGRRYSELSTCRGNCSEVRIDSWWRLETAAREEREEGLC
ncbi:hypothetical protein DPMN_063105 [Dreissena polymorpha]|uniref:Uncharacterized protein n=1 Tax=Dreissena polymorpha TaxID=45954 RepID=A0A9D4CB29_DREPO|nr:hypothetical protein DPMN_063105 [Dreissena polymorpha]